MRGHPSTSGRRPPQDPDLLPPNYDGALPMPNSLFAEAMYYDPGPSDRRPPQDSNLQHPIHDDALHQPSLMFAEMTGEWDPSNSWSPQDPNLQAPIDAATAAAAWRLQDPSPRTPISSIPAAFLPDRPSRQPCLDLSSQPPIVADASSTSCSPDHCPPKDPDPQPPSPQPLVINGPEFGALELLEVGSWHPIIISPHFPLNLLTPLEATISAERNRPPESQRFEVANPDTLDQLRQKFADLLTRAEALDRRDKRCRVLVNEMWRIRSRIKSIQGIPVEGIDLQIEALNAAIYELSLERDLVRRQCGR